MNVRKRIWQKDILEYWMVFLLISASGFFYFQVLRMSLTLEILALTIVVLIVAFKTRLSKVNINIALLITLIMFINTVVNIDNGFNRNDALITLMKVFYLMIVLSNMTFDSFKKKYIMLMIIIAVVSLICFLLVNVFAIGSLPGQHLESFVRGPVSLTPYYTIGLVGEPFIRNSGPFEEPGSYQIFLNIALFLILSENSKMLGLKKKSYFIGIVVFVATILTTQSTTGYICMGLIFVANVFNNKKSNNKVLSIVLLVILIIVENKTHIMEFKLNGGGSFLTRSNDTISGYSIALTKPILGYGIFQTNKTTILEENGIDIISNGLASLAISAGLVLTAVYLICIYLRLKKLFPYGWIFSFLIFAFYFLSLNAEGGALNLIFLCLLFRWRKDKFQTKQLTYQSVLVSSGG